MWYSESHFWKVRNVKKDQLAKLSYSLCDLLKGDITEKK